MSETKIITELPKNTVKLITATQIATSVSNIVKELVENSLDAGSTVIRVKMVLMNSSHFAFILKCSFNTYSRKIVDFPRSKFLIMDPE